MQKLGPTVGAGRVDVGIPNNYEIPLNKGDTNVIVVSAAVDIGNTVKETNEANNQCSYQVTIIVSDYDRQQPTYDIQTTPDLRCEVHAYDLFDARDGSAPRRREFRNGQTYARGDRTIKVYFSVKNSSNAGIAGPSRTAFSMTHNGYELPVTWDLGSTAHIPVQALRGSQTWESQEYNVKLIENPYQLKDVPGTPFQTRPKFENRFDISADVDFDHTISELNETNNQCSSKFTVVWP